MTTKLTFESFEIEQNNTRINEISPLELYFVSDVLSAQIQENVNKQLQQNAIDLRVVPGLTLHESKIDAHEGVLQISTDFNYETIFTSR